LEPIVFVWELTNLFVVKMEKFLKVLEDIEKGSKLVSVDLSSCGLTEFPIELFKICESIEILNLGGTKVVSLLFSLYFTFISSGNKLKTLPLDMPRFSRLRILFFAQNEFETIPVQLGQIPSLFMLSFKSNNLKYIDESALSSSISWLILTDNKLTGDLSILISIRFKQFENTK
jgi:Leucine-rich repeat (LRR) protein